MELQQLYEGEGYWTSCLDTYSVMELQHPCKNFRGKHSCLNTYSVRELQQDVIVKILDDRCLNTYSVMELQLRKLQNIVKIQCFSTTLSCLDTNSAMELPCQVICAKNLTLLF